MMWVCLRRAFAVKTAADPRFFPSALKTCSKAGQALDLYINTPTQFSFQQGSVPLLETLRRLRLPKDAVPKDYDCLTEVTLLKDARFTRFVYDLLANINEVALDALLGTYTILAQLYAPKLPTELAQPLLARLQQSLPELSSNPLLISKALRLCPALGSQTLPNELIDALEPALPAADLETTLNAVKAAIVLPRLRQYLTPKLQPLLLKVIPNQYISRMPTGDLTRTLIDADRFHILSQEVLEEGVNTLVGRLYTLTASEAVQTLKIYESYCAGKELAEVSRVPEQCARTMIQSLRTTSPADLLYVLETLPRFQVTSSIYYELFSVEVVRNVSDYSLKDLVTASCAMATVGLKSDAFVKTVVARVRQALEEESDLVINPETQQILGDLKSELFPELEQKQRPQAELSLPTPQLAGLLWSLSQLAMRTEEAPLLGEEWNALLKMLNQRLSQRSPQRLSFTVYERLTQVAWFTRKFFPTLPPFPIHTHLAAFDLNSEDPSLHLDSYYSHSVTANLNDTFCRSFAHVCTEKEVEFGLPGLGLEHNGELFLQPDGVFVNAVVDSTPVLLVRATDVDRSGRVAPLLSCKFLMLQTARVSPILLHFAEWRAAFSLSPARGDEYISSRLPIT